MSAPCGDPVGLPGWTGHCTKDPDHEPPHEGTGVNLDTSEVALLAWVDDDSDWRPPKGQGWEDG